MSLIRASWFYLILPLIGIGTPVIGTAAQAADKANNKTAATVYQEECASCHMAYPAELLPTRSWLTILHRLDQHFGENASLDPATLQTLRQYLQDNSADVTDSRRARKILRTLAKDDTPLRISDMLYIRRKHHEIPPRYITANPKVKSLSNCVACHAGAEQGSFNEHQVRIPGYGHWDD